MNTTTDEQINEALKVLDQAPVAEGGTQDARQEQPEPHLEVETDEGTLSPTLEGLAASLRPKQKTACETCPNSVWFASPVEVKCYCRVMFLVSWSTKEPNQITACDGMFLGQEA